MSEGLDNLLAEAFSKSIFKEDREIESGDERKKSKKSKHKSKNKTKHSKSSERKKSINNKSNNNKSNNNNNNNNNENETEVMKLLLSSQLKSYASIPFKDNEAINDSNESIGSETKRKKSVKHKNDRKEEEKHKSDKHSKRCKSEDICNEDSYVRYYSSDSQTAHEDYYYGSYYEGITSKPTHSSSKKKTSRPLSPLYETSWKNHRSRSRSPFPKKIIHNRRSLSPEEKRSQSPFYKSRYFSDSMSRSRRRSLSPNNKSQRRSCDRNKSVDRYEKIDKQKLLEIARENLLKMIEKGDLPKGTDVNKLKLKHLRELTTQKSVQQWTEFCRAISELESAVHSDSDLDSDYDSDDDKCSVKSDHPFTARHPFQLKEKKDIAIKVRDFVQLPNRSANEMALELRKSFPVSSGNQHRRKEFEWKEVQQMPPPPPPKKGKRIETKLTTAPDVNKSVPNASSSSSTETNSNNNSDSLTEPSNESEPKSDSVFPQSSMPIDIGSVMAQRLSAMRKLQVDPHNVVALKQMYQSNQMMTEWAESKIIPGQFTGSTGANVLTGDQLNGPINAWTRKDQLKTAAPITDGIGMYLLIKMGWNPGQGLGKNNEGVVDPIMLDIKMDKKGLVAEQEEVRNLPLQLVSVPKQTTGKNPVSIIHELCAKKKWGTPVYEQVFEQGPDHRKNFMFKVIVNGVEYQPSVSSANKKQARALAAGVCLQAFGLLPKDKN